MKVGVIGATGWLGGAIAEAMLEADLVRPQDLTLSYRRARPDRFDGAHWTSDNQELAERSDAIIVSVRPEDWPALAVRAGGRLVISVMAGVRLADLGDRMETRRVVRALPNAAAEVGRSHTPWFAGDAATEEDRTTVRTIFGSCGTEDEVRSERQIDYLSGLSGTGPAYPALLAAAMMEDAVAFGVPPEIARRAANAVIVGAGRLMEREDAAPADIVRTFLAYRGVTAAGIAAMRGAGFDAAVAKGLRAGFDKARAMSSG